VKVLLVVIDAASPRVVCPAIQTGRLPVLQQLAAAGAMHDSSVTIFPSITPAATTSIITGAYPDEHGIAGASWFEEQRNEIAYYGDDFWVIAREGFGAFLRDFLVRLNGDRLHAPTLFELVERTGRRAACLNYLVFRGRDEHVVNVPFTLAILPGVPRRETVNGPSTLSLGSFVSESTDRGKKLRGKESLLHRFGMDDEGTGALLLSMMEQRALPNFTVAYFADNDYRSHEVGPHAALPVIERVDELLGRAFEAAGGLDRVLEDTLVIVTSDHGHCEILGDAARSVVRLAPVLDEFRCAALGKPWKKGDELMICPNMRAAQIYVRDPSPDRIRRVVDALMLESRVDQVMWRAELTGGDEGTFCVTSHRGSLTFSRGDGRRDQFGGSWDWEGEGEALQLEYDRDAIDSRDYPNAFERIAGVLDGRNAGEIWVTAAPGCEFEVQGGDAHVGGGSHGALHALDSLSPVIVGGPKRIAQLPRVMRSIDIAPLCMRALGLEMRYAVGDARPGRRASSVDEPASSGSPARSSHRGRSI
jgi:hypothetical protein